jgi:hypothetical protein
LVYTTGELPTRPFDATRFLTPSPHQNRCRRPRVEKVGLAEIAERKGTAWLEIKQQRERTNAETDKLWEATADGRREAYLKIYLKGLQAKRGALILEWKSNNGTF